MSATFLEDPVPISTTTPGEPQLPAASDAAAASAQTQQLQLVSAQCECCGLTEDCTPEYLSRVRDRHAGRWICGLCAEAVEEELFRSDGGRRGPISTEEAVLRHVAFCSQFRSSSPPQPASPSASEDDLISAVVQLLRRSLSSPSTRSTPSSPVRRGQQDDGEGAPRPLGRSGSCLPTLAG